MPDQTPTHDVIIVGAGPVGLFLAGELGLAGVPALVLEKSDEAAAPLKQLPFGMRGLSPLTLDAFARRDLREAVLEVQRASAERIGAAAHWSHQRRRPAGHFAGIPFFHDAVDSTRWPFRLPTDELRILPVELAALEAVLARRAIGLGATIRRGAGVEHVEQEADHVRVRAGGRDLRCRWLVGCDGGRSAVRKLAGFAFEGTEPEITGYSVDAEIAAPNPLAPGRTHTASGVFTFAPPGTLSIAEFDGGAFHRAGPLTLDHVQAVLRRVSGTDVTLAALRMVSTWTDRAYQATSLRRGRVLLAGDAAHTHSPLGGQGLNLGLGDAMNLGWKLAAVAGGSAPAGLLDSYQEERHPVGAQVLDWSRAQIALMRPTTGTHALQGVVRDLLETGDGAMLMAERVWGIGLRYDLGGTHPMVGRVAPGLTSGDDGRVGQASRAGKGLLLAADAASPVLADATLWHGRVVTGSSQALATLGVAAVLVRPDGVVAWAGEAGTGDDGLAEAGSRWFGAPGHAVDDPAAGL